MTKGGDAMNTATIQIRTDPEVKAESRAIFEALGITMSDAVNIFLRQAIREGGFPFEVKLRRPNKTTLAAMEDVEQAIRAGVKGTKDFDAFLADLEAD
jgi:DNA-damage-inducible protein J